MKRFLAFGTLLAAAVMSHAALPFYELKDVGPWKPDMVVDWSSPRVNEEGHVAFSVTAPYDAVAHYIPAAGHTYSVGAGGQNMKYGIGINDQWALTGCIEIGSFIEACMSGNGWDFVMGRPAGYNSAYGMDINNNYDVIGIAGGTTSGVVAAFKYTFAAGFQILPNYAGSGLLASMRPYALNASGDVCGQSYAAPTVSTDIRGWFWNGSATTPMPFVGPADTTSACFDVNDYRVVVGHSGNQACYWFPDWGITGYLPVAPGDSQVRAITNTGIMVGTNNAVAVAWEGVSPPVSLQSRVIAGGAGWNLIVATDNTEIGYITGIGYKNGQARVFLLKPL